MADSNIDITQGSGTSVDTRTESTNGNHRQVVVIGDPSSNTGVAPVDGTNGLAVDVKQSALPTGAATSAKQDTIIGHLDGVEGLLTTIDGDTGNIALDTAAIKTAVEILDNAIAGSEMQVDVVTSALPTGASTEAKQDTQITSLQLLDDVVGTDLAVSPTKGVVIGGHQSGAGTNFNIAHVSSGGALKVDLNGALTNLESDADAIRIAVETIDNAIAGSEMQVDVVTSALPTGASTAANQATIIGHLDGVEGLLTTIDSDTGALAACASGTELQVDVVTSALPTGAATETTSASILAAVNDYSMFRNTAVSDSAISVKGSSGRLSGCHIYNPNTADAFVQLYDLASGSVVVGTTTPNWTLWIPAGGAIDGGIPPNLFSNAISVAATTTITGGTAPSTGLLVNFQYK